MAPLSVDTEPYIDAAVTSSVTTVTLTTFFSELVKKAEHIPKNEVANYLKEHCPCHGFVYSTAGSSKTCML